jgi:hypothetical protein
MSGDAGNVPLLWLEVSDEAPGPRRNGGALPRRFRTGNRYTRRKKL